MRGKILAGFHIDEPRLIPAKKMKGHKPAPKPEYDREEQRGLKAWVAACRSGKQDDASFLYASSISEAFNLGAIACRTGKRLEWDAQNMKITNVPDANQYLTREYRKGWEL